MMAITAHPTNLPQVKTTRNPLQVPKKMMIIISLQAMWTNAASICPTSAFQFVIFASFFSSTCFVRFQAKCEAFNQKSNSSISQKTIPNTIIIHLPIHQIPWQWVPSFLTSHCHKIFPNFWIMGFSFLSTYAPNPETKSCSKSTPHWPLNQKINKIFLFETKVSLTPWLETKIESCSRPITP